MPLDLNGLADLVVLTVKNAIAPLRQELALVQQENANLRAQLAGVGELRDRFVAFEAKSSLPLHVAEPTPPIDVSALLERLTIVEVGQSATLTELRDRSVEQAARLRGVETKIATQPASVTAPEVELAIRDRLEPVLASVSDARERLSAVEARAPIPGPPGENGTPGTNGQDGVPGRDGADGLGFDDLSVEQDGRNLVLKFQRGSQVKTFPLQLPFLQYEGVYIEGKSYEQGAVVTWAGSTWHANEQTATKPGDGSRAWTLIVKKGRDGKDGK